MSDQQYDEAFDAAAEAYYAAEDPKTQLAAIEHLARLADSFGDIVGGYNARMELIHCSTFAGKKDKALVAFTWCLAQADKAPDQFDPHSLLWKFKWILETLPMFAQIPKQKIYALQEDMQRRLIDNGYNLRPIHFLRWTIAMRMGELDRARDYFEQWQATTRDDMADCRACEQNKLSEYYARIGDFEQSASTAEKLLDGRMTCAEIPHFTYGHLVPTYLQLGRVEELKDKHLAWYKLIKDNEEFLGPVSSQLFLMGATSQFPKAVAMFEQHTPWAIQTVNESRRFTFYNAASLVFEKMAKSESTIRLHMTDEFELKREDQTYDCDELANWLKQQTAELASQFDQRNGNNYYAELMASSKNLFASV